VVAFRGEQRRDSMIDAERLLGSLVQNAMGGKKRRRKKRRRSSSMLSPGAKGGLALGALGVAFGVFEHLSKQQAGSGSASGMTGAPLPSLPQGAGGSAPLPPLPSTGATPQASAPLPPVPSPAPPTPDAAGAKQNEALLLVRAMIAAANADHEVDDEERRRIVQSLEESGLGQDERQFVLAEIEAPMDLTTLAAQANTPDLAAQVYLASLMAIDVDTRAEEKYLERLAERLGLDAARVSELEALLENEQ
jgi:uncharacterized membrane protein YebE (DUF533 family)